MNNPINLIDSLGLIEFENIRTIVNVVSIADVLPIGMIPGIPQVVGEVIDIAAVAGTQGVLVADLGSESITWNQFVAGSVLNAANFVIGTAGNIVSGTGNILLSVVEGGILYLQYRVTTPLAEPCE